MIPNDMYGPVPEWASLKTLEYILSIRDVNGLPVITIEGLVELAEQEYRLFIGNQEFTDEDLEEARYELLRYAGVSEDMAEMFRYGLSH